MSRVGAGVGAVGGALVATIGAGAIGFHVSMRHAGAERPEDLGDSEYANVVADARAAGFVASLIGGAIGAAIGAGSCTPKDVGVGALEVRFP